MNENHQEKVAYLWLIISKLNLQCETIQTSNHFYIVIEWAFAVKIFCCKAPNLLERIYVDCAAFGSKEQL